MSLIRRWRRFGSGILRTLDPFAIDPVRGRVPAAPPVELFPTSVDVTSWQVNYPFLDFFTWTFLFGGDISGLAHLLFITCTCCSCSCMGARITAARCTRHFSLVTTNRLIYFLALILLVALLFDNHDTRPAIGTGAELAQETPEVKNEEPYHPEELHLRDLRGTGTSSTGSESPQRASHSLAPTKPCSPTFGYSRRNGTADTRPLGMLVWPAQQNQGHSLWLLWSWMVAELLGSNKPGHLAYATADGATMDMGLKLHCGLNLRPHRACAIPQGDIVHQDDGGPSKTMPAIRAKAQAKVSPLRLGHRRPRDYLLRLCRHLWPLRRQHRLLRTRQQPVLRPRKKKLLEALLPHLKDADSLPTNLRDQIQELSSRSTQLEAKSLHATVNSRKTAKQALNRLDLEREVFEQGWLTYVDQLSALLVEQVKERDAALQKFEENRKTWEAQLQEATQELQRADAADIRSVEEEHTLHDETMSSSATETPKAEQRGAFIQAKQQQLAMQLQSLSQSLTSQHRERTPRRQRTDGGPPNSQEKTARDKIEPADKPAEGGSMPPPQ